MGIAVTTLWVVQILQKTKQLVAHAYEPSQKTAASNVWVSSPWHGKRNIIEWVGDFLSAFYSWAGDQSINQSIYIYNSIIPESLRALTHWRSDDKTEDSKEEFGSELQRSPSVLNYVHLFLWSSVSVNVLYSFVFVIVCFAFFGASRVISACVNLA